MQSSCSRSSLASRNASAIIAKGSFEPSASWNAPDWTIATLRCGEENSSARIFMGNSPFVFTEDFNFHAPHIGHLKCVVRHSVRPFNHRHAVRSQIILNPSRVNLLFGFETVQIEMKQREPAASVNVDQRETR